MTTIDLAEWLEVGECIPTRKISRLRVRQLLNIQSRDTINEHCNYLGIRDRSLTWSQVKDILAMNLFVRAGYGRKFSRTRFLRLRRTNLLDLEFQKLGISLQDEFKRTLANGSRITSTGG